MRNAWGAFVVSILTLAGLGVGGYAVYQAGYRQGLLEDAGEVVVHGYGYFPGFGIFFGFIFLFFLFGIIGRFFFGRPWRGGGYGPRRWDHQEGNPMEKRLEEWHEKAHSPGRTYRSDRDDTT